MPPERGSAAGQKFLPTPNYRQCGLCASMGGGCCGANFVCSALRQPVRSVYISLSAIFIELCMYTHTHIFIVTYTQKADTSIPLHQSECAWLCTWRFLPAVLVFVGLSVISITQTLLRNVGDSFWRGGVYDQQHTIRVWGD